MKLANTAQPDKNIKQAAVIFAVLVIFAIACVGQKKLTNSSAADLVIREAYTQKQVPGTPGRKPEVYLFVMADPPGEAIQLDSVLYNKKMYTLRRSGLYSKTKIKEGKQAKDPSNQTLLYYTKNNKSHYCVIGKVEKKEPVYLP